MMEDLKKLIGSEQRLAGISLALRDQIRALHAPVVGAMHVTCADETEGSCADTFQRVFVSELLPSLKFAQKAPFRLSNPGSRYESGALGVAEHHFATAEARTAFKVMVVKINAHVAADGSGEQTQYGKMRRYEAESSACGALHALLAGGDTPFLSDLRGVFTSDGKDRIRMLLDPRHVVAEHRSLLAAIVNARLQARRVEEEIGRLKPASPTLYLVVPCVTLNRSAEDTELMCGLCVADQRTHNRTHEYHGLGDDPTHLQVKYIGGRLQVREEPPAA